MTMQQTVWAILRHYASQGNDVTTAIEATAKRLAMTVEDVRTHAGRKLA